jgi:signal transduction histidine kinase
VPMTSSFRPAFRATPDRTFSLVRDFLLSPFDMRSWLAVGSIVLGFFSTVFAFAILASIFSTGGSMLILLVGVPIIGMGIEWARLVARFERWRMTLVDPRPLRPHAYRPIGQGPRALAEAIFIDENRWRDVIYLVVAFPLAILEWALALALWSCSVALVFTPAILYAIKEKAHGQFPASIEQAMPAIVATCLIIGLALLPVAASASRGLMVMHRAVAEALLCASERDELRQRVETLRDSRSAMLQVEASELRRIERDLHDGAQQRLVMLAIDLSLAADKVDKDPRAAKALMNDAREQARQALAELRDLVRGSAPSILLDRGLVAALGSIAGRCPVPTMVESALPAGERQPHAVERAAYFVVAEALTNVAKHAQATACEIRCRRESGRLIVEVWDNGKGGASLSDGGGLAGLRDRVEALDGTLRVDSPDGGPTLLRAELPTGTE